MLKSLFYAAIVVSLVFTMVAILGGCARIPKYNCDTVEFLSNPRCV